MRPHTVTSPAPPSVAFSCCNPVVTLTFLSVWSSLPVIPWPLRSTRHFCRESCSSLDIFCTVLCKTLKMAVWEYPDRSAVSEMLNSHSTFKATSITFCPHSDARFERQWVSKPNIYSSSRYTLVSICLFSCKMFHFVQQRLVNAACLLVGVRQITYSEFTGAPCSWKWKWNEAVSCRTRKMRNSSDLT